MARSENPQPPLSEGELEALTTKLENWCLSAKPGWSLPLELPQVRAILYALAPKSADFTPPIPLVWPPQGWRCPSCHCSGYAHMDELGPDGHYHSGPNIRCVECKREWYAPPPIPLVAGEAVARIIDPEAWQIRDTWIGETPETIAQMGRGRVAAGMPTLKDRCAPSLAKAEQIITLLAHIKAGEPK